MLQTVENKIVMPPEIAIEAEKYQFIQRLNRAVMDEYLEQRDQEINRTVTAGNALGKPDFPTTLPDRIVTPGSGNAEQSREERLVQTRRSPGAKEPQHSQPLLQNAG